MTAPDSRIQPEKETGEMKLAEHEQHLIKLYRQDLIEVRLSAKGKEFTGKVVGLMQRLPGKR